jgi:triacylglycerol lipase
MLDTGFPPVVERSRNHSNMMKRFTILLFFLSAVQSICAQCDKSKRPVVFIHGFLASGDSYAAQVQRFIQAGYCGDRLFVFDWNTITQDGKVSDSLLENFIDNVLRQTGASQIDLVGHSAGGGLGRGYLIDSMHAKNVAHYVHIGSRKWSYEYGWFPNKKCLNIYSAGDKVAGSAGGVVEGAVNLDQVDKDHYEVATSEESFQAMFMFFREGVKPVMKKVKTNVSDVRGRAVLLGTNEPLVRARVEVYVTDTISGQRKSTKPVHSFTTDDQGRWGPFLADTLLNYELALVPADTASRRISYFFEPFTLFNRQVYLRGFPTGNMVAMMLGNVPKKADQSALVIYSSSNAMIAGRDSVTVNGIPVSSTLLTPAAKTIISSFIFDDGDGKTSGLGLKQYSRAPFIGGTDIFLPVSQSKGHTVLYNGRKIVLPAVPSAEKIVLAVFN